MAQEDLRTFHPITEYPLPTTGDEVEQLGEDHPTFEAEDLTPHGVREKYAEVYAETSDWEAFKIHLLGHEHRVYFWNRSMGEGIAIPTHEWNCGSFVEIVALFQEAVTSDREDRPIEPDGDGGCPYCGGELTSSMMPSGSFDQRCSSCGETRSVG